MEDDQEYQLIQKILTKLNLDQYLQDFKTQEVNDELVQEDVVGDQQCLAVIIPVLGHKFKFIKELKAALGIGAKPQSSIPATTSETDSEALQELENRHRPVTTTKKGAKTSKQESLASQPKSGDVYNRIAAKLGFTFQSRGGVMKKVHNEATDQFNHFMDVELADVDFLFDEDMEEKLKAAEDKAFIFFEDVIEDLDEITKRKEIGLHQKRIVSRKNFYRNLNYKHKKDSEKKGAAAAAKVLSTHFNLSKVTEEFGNGKVELDLMAEVYEAWVSRANKDFDETCGSSLVNGTIEFSNKVENSWESLLEQVRIRNNKIDKNVEKLKSKVIDDYQQQMANVMEAGDFITKHEKVVAQIRKTINDAQLDVKSKNTCLESFETQTPNLKTSAHEGMLTRVKKLNEDLKNITEESLKVYAGITSLILAEGSPVFGPSMIKNHMNGKKKALERLDTDLKTLEESLHLQELDEQTRISILKSAEQEIDNKLKENEAINSERWAQLETELEALADDLIAKYIEDMKHVANVAVDENSLNFNEKRLRDAAVVAYLAHMKPKKLDLEFTTKKEETLVARIETEKQGFFRAFAGQLKIDKISVNAALLKSKGYYKEEMDKKFMEKQWYDPSKLEEIHLQVLQHAIYEAKIDDEDGIQLTESQEAQLRKAFETFYLKYKEQNNRQNPINEPAIGIDLGTTYSCVGVFVGKEVQIIGNFNASQKTTVPSYVAFNQDGTVDVGDVAEANVHKNPENTVFDAKRLIGKKYEDSDVQKDLKYWPFDVVDDSGEPRILIHEKKYRPEEISAKVLVKMKSIAEEYLGKEVTKAVVTVPAYFGDAQRKATKDAAYIAGLQATILNEPTAAAMCYELHRIVDSERNVLVFDLGGGTFDVVISTSNSGKKDIRIISIGGDTHLGGRDFDNNMMEALVERVKDNHGIDLARGRDSTDTKERLKAISRLRRLQTACEQHKRILSQTTKTTVTVNMLDDNFDLDEEFTREEFDRINEPLFNKCIEILDNTIKEAKLKKSQIHDIVLVGGSTRIPKVQELLKNFFGGRKTLSKTIDPDQAVAYGAAYHAATLQGDQLPDGHQTMVYNEVTSFDLGVAVYPEDETEGVMNVLIPKNSRIPITTKGEESYTTGKDYQTTCEIDVYEGPHKYVKDNTLLGQFKLTGIRPARAGQELMECKMTIDEEGVLQVEAHCITSGKRETLKIESYNGRMSMEEKEAARKQDHSRWI